MTSEEFSLFPARGDDGGAPLRRFQFAASGVLEFAQGLGAEVRERMALEPSPEVLHWIEFGSVGGQELDQDLPVGGVHVVAHQTAAVRFAAIPQDEQPAAIVGFERFEEFDDLLFPDRAFVKPETHPAIVHSSDHRNVVPVEAELKYRSLAPWRPGAHPRGAL